MSSKNFIGNKIVYYPNSNGFASTLVLPQNRTNSLKKFVKANFFIYLKKTAYNIAYFNAF